MPERSYTLVRLDAEPLSVPLWDPFVIATGRVEATRSVLVTARVRGADGGEAVGLGEAAALPPVTREDQPEVLEAIARSSLAGVSFTGMTPAAALDAAFAKAPVARSGVEMALLDAVARLERVPVFTLLSGGAVTHAAELVTDMTLPILAPERMAELAAGYWAKGFRAFKLKVGRALAEDLASLASILRATPGATLRIDANGGFSAEDALGLLAAARSHGFAIECFEQPCAPEDEAGLAQVTREAGVPVVADESVKTLADLQRVIHGRLANGVNLKIAKSGGLLAAFELGRAAKASGLRVMVGGMVETRLGMTAASHLAAALGGVDYPDLDTAWLLREDRFVGGYRENGPRYTLPNEPGLGTASR